MINYQTILSNYNERGTLLKWLRTLQTALEGGSLETVTTTTTDDSVVFHFGFADGTSLDSPPIQLEAGPPGTAATVEIGNVSTLPAGSDATVVNTGTTTAAVLDFGIPQGIAGQDGDDGAAATVAIGTVTTLPAGSSATVVNSGTSSAAVFDFGIPQGTNGDPGEVIEQIVPVEATTTASRPYLKGAYFVNNLGILVQATAAIALGATIDSTNTTAVNKTLAEALDTRDDGLDSRITTLEGQHVYHGFFDLAPGTTGKTISSSNVNLIMLYSATSQSWAHFIDICYADNTSLVENKLVTSNYITTEFAGPNQIKIKNSATVSIYIQYIASYPITIT